jgi:seryl-tRNA synthetase
MPPSTRKVEPVMNEASSLARRLNIRHRPDGGATETVATLNGTLATTRWLVALLEMHQNANGSVTIPEALRPYLGGLAVAEPLS